MKRVSCHLGKITGEHSRPQFHLSLLGSLASYGRGGAWQWKWERPKITGGGQGSYNKPIGCGASGAYAPGPDEEEEERSYLTVTICSVKAMPGHCCRLCLHRDFASHMNCTCGERLQRSWNVMSFPTTCFHRLT